MKLPRIKNSSLDLLTAEAKNLGDRIVSEKVQGDERPNKRSQTALECAVKNLMRISEELDQVLRPIAVYDPTASNSSIYNTALVFSAQERFPLADIPEFYGSGVYGLYYTGNFEAYKPLSGMEHPIYIGKADQDNLEANDPVSQGTKILGRLNKHAKSIMNAIETINIDDFEFRFLVVRSGFQKSTEDFLIHFFKPIWNFETGICYGIGKNGDKATTRVNKRSPWDTIHAGREWAALTIEDQKTKNEIFIKMTNHFCKFPPYSHVDKIMSLYMKNVRQT